VDEFLQLIFGALELGHLDFGILAARVRTRTASDCKSKWTVLGIELDNEGSTFSWQTLLVAITADFLRIAQWKDHPLVKAHFHKLRSAVGDSLLLLDWQSLACSRYYRQLVSALFADLFESSVDLDRLKLLLRKVPPKVGQEIIMERGLLDHADDLSVAATENPTCHSLGGTYPSYLPPTSQPDEHECESTDNASRPLIILGCLLIHHRLAVLHIGRKYASSAYSRTLISKGAVFRHFSDYYGRICRGARRLSIVSPPPPADFGERPSNSGGSKHSKYVAPGR